MKTRIPLLLFFCIMCATLYSQTYSFTYDAAGNRIKREIVLDIQKAVEASQDSLEEALMDEKKDEIFKDKLEKAEIRLYPNPTEGLLIVDLPAYDPQLAITIEVFDVQGRKLITLSPATEHNEVDLSKQAAGVYILRLHTQSQQVEWRIVKK